MSYKHLTRDDRVTLAALLWAGKNQVQCALKLGVDKSAIKREITRNSDEDGVYRPRSAHKKYLERRKKAKQPTRKIENNLWLQKYIIKRLKKKHWSPEQIAGRLRDDRNETLICHETIYQWIYNKKPELEKYLRRKKNKYRRKRGTKQRAKQREEAKIRRIDKRPDIVETRERIGDWEGDTIIGKERTQRILTHNERKSGYLIADKLDKVTAKIIENKTIERFKKIPKSKRFTITYDNGSEFGEDDIIIEKKAKVKVYRANPYHSWERGSNENLNGLLREFFPKGIMFDTITQKDVDRAVRLINHRPRKRLNYLTPYEVFVKGKSCTSR